LRFGVNTDVHRLLALTLIVGTIASVSGQSTLLLRTIAWDEIAPALQQLLQARGIDGATFASRVADVRRRNLARVREGDLDHLIFYVLQSTAFTTLTPIEPAASAKEFLDRRQIPRSVQARFDAFETALAGGPRDARLTYFRDVVARERTAGASTRSLLDEQYARVMPFLYDKEFGAGRRSADPATATGLLYHDRGLSTDTSVEAGYVVYLALAALHQLEPQRRIRRVLIVGPGLDLAPRTGLVEAGDPQSYQPFTVMDALLGLGLAERDRLRVTALDINPRVTGWFSRARGTRPRLTLVSGVADVDRVHLLDDYREYFAGVGKVIGAEHPLRTVAPGHLAKIVELQSWVTNAVDVVDADIVVDRLDEQYDLVVVTNVFPYLSDADLLLALANISRTLAPAGVLLHNEPRPLVADATLALGLTLVHARTAILASVEGARTPLYDSIFIHRR
jgi:SAM-dependent methyltransferase